MRPEEVLYHIKTAGEFFAVPEVYRGMSHQQLADLAAECQKPSADQRDSWYGYRSSYPKTMREAVREAEEAAIEAWKAGLLPPAAEEPDSADGEAEHEEDQDGEDPAEDASPSPTLLDRALARRERGDEGRLSTPARRRAAFLHHLTRCHTIAEAAARTGIDRRTVARWRRALPAFAARCEAVIAERRRTAIEDVVLAADQIETRPVFHRGRKVGEYTRRDRTLALYLLKQADAEALRAEKRRETEAAIEARIQEEVERRISAMSRSAGHPADAATDESVKPVNDLAALEATAPSCASVPENVPSPAVAPADVSPAESDGADSYRLCCHPERSEGPFLRPQRPLAVARGDSCDSLISDSRY